MKNHRQLKPLPRGARTGADSEVRTPLKAALRAQATQVQQQIAQREKQDGQRQVSRDQALRLVQLHRTLMSIFGEQLPPGGCRCPVGCHKTVPYAGLYQHLRSKCSKRDETPGLQQVLDAVDAARYATQQKINKPLDTRRNAG